MEKAYDLKELLAKWKKSVPDLAEEAAKQMTKDVFSFLKESAVLSKNPLDDVGLAIYPVMEKKILELEDKIDGQEG